MTYEFLKRIKIMQKMLKEYQELNVLLKVMDENQKVNNIIYDKQYYENIRKRMNTIGAKMEKINTILSVVEF